MGRLEELGAMLDALDGIRRRVQKLVEARERSWRVDLIKERRALACLFARLSEVMTTAMEQSRGTGADRSMVREAWQTMRNTNAMHQANFPISAADHGNEEYHASLIRVLTATNTFVLTAKREYQV